MLEALYEKTCLPKCSGNTLNLHFEYLNDSVAQKITELQIFGCHQLLTAYNNKNLPRELKLGPNITFRE